MVLKRRKYLAFLSRIKAAIVIQKFVRMFLAKQKLKYLKGKKELELYSKALREKLEQERKAKEEEEQKQRRDRLQKKLEMELRQKEHIKYLHGFIGPNRPYSRGKAPVNATITTTNTKPTSGMTTTRKNDYPLSNPKENGGISKMTSIETLGNIYLKKQGAIIPRAKGPSPSNALHPNINGGRITKQSSINSVLKNLDMSQMSEGESINYDSLYQIFTKNHKI